MNTFATYYYEREERLNTLGAPVAFVRDLRLVSEVSK